MSEQKLQIQERTRKNLTDNRPRLPHGWMSNWEDASSYVFDLIEDESGEKMILISFE